MQHRLLGSSGLQVPILGLGTASFGDLYGRMDDAQAAATVRAALDLGITLLDTSPYYGITLAETRLGKALAGIPPDVYLLVTKCGRYGVDDFDFTPARIARSLDQSLARLGVDHVDLLLLHDVEFADLDRIVGDSIPALADLKDTGKARLVGVSGLPLGALLRCARTGLLDAVLSYCHRTLLDTTLDAALPEFQERGVGVLNASPLAMGLFSPQGPQSWHPAPAAVQEHCRRAVEHCRRAGADPARLALQFAMAQPGVASTLCGAASPAEVAACAAAAAEPIDQALLAEVRALLAPVRDVTWRQGRPENNP